MRASGMSGFRPRFFIATTAIQRETSEGRSPCAKAIPKDSLEASVCALSPEDSYHALKVLRLREGDECEVVVGAAVYAATIVEAAYPVMVRLVAQLTGPDVGADYRVSVGLVQALARPAVMDDIFEKGTEVGASFFVLVRAAGSPKSSAFHNEDRMARWRRITYEAAKQSKQVVVPSVDFAGPLEDALDLLGQEGTSSLVLEPSSPLGLKEAVLALAEPARLALWVGPEGGWAAAELDCFKRAGARIARLGRSVLRTETAGPVAVAVARLALEDW